MKKFNLLKGLALSLLTLALCFVAFGAVKAKAEVKATYDPETDTIHVTGSTSAEATVYYIDLGKSGAQKIKAGKVQTLSLSGNETSGYSGNIVLDNKDEGLKVAEKKTIYLYISKDNPENDLDQNEKIKTKSANVTIKGSTAPKFTITLNYVCAESGEDSMPAFNAADKNGKALDQADFIFRFSEDGKTFGEWKPAGDFTPDELYKAITTGEGKYTYQFKYKKAGERDSAPVKVKVAKAAKAPKIKVDYVKGTVALKNGFDYYVSSSSSAPETLEGWISILPTNKAGKAEKDDVYRATIEVAEEGISAKPKTDTEKLMYAKSTEKIKSVDISRLFEDAENFDYDPDEHEKIYLYVRKSATTKKPASAVSEVKEIPKKAAAPGDVSSVSGAYDEKKKVWSFELSSSSGELEYLILADASTPTDLGEAKWVKAGKGLVVGKSKTKVSKAKTNTLKKDSYILVRIAGVKETSLPSDAFKLQVVKTNPTGSGSAENLILDRVNE